MTYLVELEEKVGEGGRERLRGERQLLVAIKVIIKKRDEEEEGRLSRERKERPRT